MYLTIKTDSKDPEIGLIDDEEIDSYVWHAGNQLSNHLLAEIENLLKNNKIEFNQLSGIIVFKGPGSFTGLRIGITVANTLAYGLNIPIVGGSGDDWKTEGVRRLINNENDTAVSPEYGADAHITQPKK